MITSMLIACAVSAAVALPLASGRLIPGSWYGLHTPLLEGHPDALRAANRVLGRLGLAASFLSVLVLLALDLEAEEAWIGWGVVIVPMAAAWAAGRLYVRRLVRQVERLQARASTSSGGFKRRNSRHSRTS